MPATLEDNLRDVQERISSAALAAGREPSEVRLLPVTKSVSPHTALALARLGQNALAEARLEALLEKRAHFDDEGQEVEWHFIGHLQRNKARRVLRNAAVVHSVDSPRLVQALDRIASEEGLRPRIYLEVKLATDPEKHGLTPAELEPCVRQAGESTNLELVGLMTLAPRPTEGSDRRAEARAVFERLAELAAALEADPSTAACFSGGRVELSMGMSGDFEEAVRAGSHVCRVGGALFRDLTPEGQA